jgi:hypothetical protein
VLSPHHHKPTANPDDLKAGGAIPLQPKQVADLWHTLFLGSGLGDDAKDGKVAVLG